MKRRAGFFVFATVLLILPLIFKDSYFLTVTGTTALFNACLAISLNLFMGFSGQVSLCHAAFYGIGAYSNAVFTTTYHFNPWISTIAGLFITGSISFILARPILKLKGHYLAMATLGLGIIIHIFFVQADNITKGPDGISGIPNLMFGKINIKGDATWYYMASLLTIFYTWLSLNLLDSRTGRALKAIHDGETGAQVSGIDTDKLKADVFVLTAMMASLAGSLLAHKEGFISPESFNLQFSVELLTMIVIGGLGSIFGSLFGAVFLTSLPEFLSKFEDFEMLVYGLILIATMIFMPQGLYVGISRFFTGILKKLIKKDE
jgi:branched-chain amino acid transport system permease protein